MLVRLQQRQAASRSVSLADKHALRRTDATLRCNGAIAAIGPAASSLSANNMYLTHAFIQAGTNGPSARKQAALPQFPPKSGPMRSARRAPLASSRKRCERHSHI